MSSFATRFSDQDLFWFQFNNSSLNQHFRVTSISDAMWLTWRSCVYNADIEGGKAIDGHFGSGHCPARPKRREGGMIICPLKCIVLK
ncbi:MAG: hypothetical protein B6D64_08615 [Bacteroidetes bacterium 4484_276]|nr:MAG: hypothetical protein B6D64_08615 [Bacteroidetes bacterium 4484_276]